MTDQTQIDSFRELNRYDDRDADYRSSAVYELPRRTAANGWAKFHAARECGSRHVQYVEADSGLASSDRYDYLLRCYDCGYKIPEDEILFVGGEWFSEHGWRHLGRPLDDLFLPPDRVLALGPDPDRNELVDALDITRIEQEASIPHLFSFGADDGSRETCEECGHAVPVTFDGRCGMCYNGPWTDRLTKTLQALARGVRERNGSYRHRLETDLSPTEPGGAPSEGEILWRRHDIEGTSKLVEVTQRFEDIDSGRREYVLWDPTHTERWQYCEEDLEDCFWATGLYNEDTKPVEDDRIREVWQRVRDS